MWIKGKLTHDDADQKEENCTDAKQQTWEKGQTKSIENFQKSRETHLAVRAKALATISLKLQSPSA